MSSDVPMMVCFPAVATAYRLVVDLLKGNRVAVRRSSQEATWPVRDAALPHPQVHDNCPGSVSAGLTGGV